MRAAFVTSPPRAGPVESTVSEIDVDGAAGLVPVMVWPNCSLFPFLALDGENTLESAAINHHAALNLSPPCTISDL